jgi:hypothetical protein
MSIGLSEDELVSILGAQFSIVKDDKLKAFNERTDFEKERKEYNELAKIPATQKDIASVGFATSAILVAIARAITANNKEIAKIILPSD